MKTDRIVWIDLTDLKAWSGHFTGIQRVVYQLALRYSIQENVRFFIYDEDRHSFFRTSFTNVDDAEVAQPVTTGKTNRIKARLKHEVKAVYFHAPVALPKTTTTS